MISLPVWIVIICTPNRFELQLEYLIKHPETDIIGGQITEFIGS